MIIIQLILSIVLFIFVGCDLTEIKYNGLSVKRFLSTSISFLLGLLTIISMIGTVAQG